MLSLDTLEQLATKLSNAVPGGAGAFKADLCHNFQAILQATFSQLSLVNREEFDRQTQLLAKARERLNALQLKIDTLEAQARR